MDEDIKPSEIWCDINHEEARSFRMHQCKYCEQWESKEILDQLGCCWKCDKRRT